MIPELSELWDEWGTTVVLVAVGVLVALVVVALVARAARKRAERNRTPEKVLREKQKAQADYDAARKRLAKMPKNVWREHTKDEIDHQRSQVDALRERVQMLDDELVQVRAKGEK